LSSNPNTKLIFGLLAITGVVIASYKLWAQEREERVKTQEELENTMAKLGRPQVTILLKDDDERRAGRLWVCLMNYTDSPAVNVKADDIPCGSQVLRFDPPPRITVSFSPDIQFYCPDQGGSSRTDIVMACAFIQKKGTEVSNTLQLAIRYTDMDAVHEWVTFGRFHYNFRTKRFELEKQWMEKTEYAPKPVLTL